jgi:hypothetical protein
VIVPEQMQEAVEGQYSQFCRFGVAGRLCLTSRNTTSDHDVAQWLLWTARTPPRLMAHNRLRRTAHSPLFRTAHTPQIGRQAHLIGISWKRQHIGRGVRAAILAVQRSNARVGHDGDAHCTASGDGRSCADPPGERAAKRASAFVSDADPQPWTHSALVTRSHGDQEGPAARAAGPFAALVLLE